MDVYNVPGAELMGENVKTKLKKVGEGVKLMPMAGPYISIAPVTVEVTLEKSMDPFT